ncbi:Pyruvate decarboxylase [Neonectria ditissima]|uniref:Pyruvate decarboxylase n=1 Tax=Neonectria ditissima TaxID=78410 RepID=A0A0P7BWQ6_9HYPO|nr:Pyruvate decarboxylase [Neonectria ditissima]
MANHVDLPEYLFRRLAQLGVRSIHGVPGDYNLTVLDYLEPAGLRWVGNANELNAGYAADGYARTKGLAALVTSFGVGELSAINAVGGAYAEKAPVVHIVGSAPRAAQLAGACLHHSLGDGNFRVFADMYRSVTVAQANLADAEDVPRVVDETLRQCVLQSRPVYIEIPSDMVRVKVAAPRGVIDLTVDGYDERLEDEVVGTLVEKMQNAKRPLILVDGFARRFGIQDSINELVKRTAIPTLTTPFGKSLVDERLPNFHGIYYGLAGSSEHSDWVKSRDLVLHFGPLRSDINTYGFTASPEAGVSVVLEADSVTIGDATTTSTPLRGVGIKSLLSKVIAKLDGLNLAVADPFPPNPEDPREILKALPPTVPDATVDQYSFWLRMSDFFRPGDMILTETGTSAYGGQSFVLPEDTTLMTSTIWLSIGYALAASQGVALAQREMVSEGTRRAGRTILFEGEGSLQMSAQAISDIIRNKLDVTMFILNNNGYTIERIIHGFHADYNDVQPWRNLEAPSYFGAPVDDPDYRVTTRSARNWGELQAVLADPVVQEGKGLNMIEVFMEMDDAPLSLRKFVEYLTKRNSGGK